MKLTLATSTLASINHFMGELLKLRTGITWTEVHYRGNAPAITDLVAGHVDVALIQLVDSLESVRAEPRDATGKPSAAGSTWPPW